MRMSGISVSTIHYRGPTQLRKGAALLSPYYRGLTQLQLQDVQQETALPAEGGTGVLVGTVGGTM